MSQFKINNLENEKKNHGELIYPAYHVWRYIKNNFKHPYLVYVGLTIILGIVATLIVLTSY